MGTTQFPRILLQFFLQKWSFPYMKRKRFLFWMSETQRPSVLHARAGLFQSFEEGRCSQKWLVCMPAAQGSSDVNVDLRYHMVQASKASHGNHWIFQSRQICITHRFRFFFQRVVALLVMAFVIVQSRCNVRKQFQLNVANWYGVLLPHPVTRFTYVSLCGVTMFAYRYVICGILLETVALLCVECA